ncbi:MAG: hypothetical protein QMC85_07150 [Methanocellales archaeon]|nr:hypothetical protein [Methanocellales archaeon]MDI6903688.1 hypothetical protein [Methanocellales archaeon]
MKLEEFLKSPDKRAKVYLFLLIAQICATLGLMIGGIILLLIALGIL